jgi:hypothetical protein
MATMAVDFDPPRQEMARYNVRFLDELRTIVGRRHVLTRPRAAIVPRSRSPRTFDPQRGRAEVGKSQRGEV